MAEEVRDETLTVEEPSEERREDTPRDTQRESAPSPASPSSAPRESLPKDPASGGDREQSSSNKKKEVQIKIFMLDGTDVVFDFERKVKAAEVIEKAHVHLGISDGENDFFSLFFFFNNQKIFLDPLKTVLHQLDKGERSRQPWKLWYGVKFYMPEPSKLKEDFSRYLYTLQLCNDIRANRVLTDRETASRLTALMLQANLGDYDPDTHKAGYTKDFEDFILTPKDVRPEDYETQLVELHTSKAGYTPAMAESEFCEVAKKLTRYGYHIFGAQDDQNTLLLIANGFNGIAIYQDKEEKFMFKWPNIVKISYRRRKFRIKYHPVNPPDGMVVIDMTEQMKLYCGKSPASKRVWKNAIEQHTFFRLNEPDQPSRVDILFRRGSRFRYSGRTLRQTEKSEGRSHHDFQRSYSERAHKSSHQSYAPGYVPSLDSFRRKKAAKSPTHQVNIGKEDDEWVVLDEPPASSEVDKTKFEQQKVQVNFSVKDGVPEDKYKAVIQRSGAGMEILSTEQGQAEPSYKLSVIDENSQSISTSVSLRVDPEEGVTLGSHGDSTMVFDSSNLPTVNINADTVTTTTVIETSGKKVSSGGVTQAYQSSQSGEAAGEEAALPANEAEDTDIGTHEAAEVDKFLKHEGELLKEVLSAQEAKTEVSDVAED